MPSLKTTAHTLYMSEIGTQSAGYYNTKSKSIYWDGQNNSGESVASGIYIYRIDIDSKSFTKKMILLK